MRRILLPFILLLFVACFHCHTMAVEPPKSREVSFARTYAKDFLVEHGADIGMMALSMEEYTDRLIFFNDMRNNLFLLMVRDGYADLVNEQVLAFSIGTPHSKARDTSTFMTLISYYDNLIKKMRDGDLPRERRDSIGMLWIKPMLHTIRWRQFGLHNLYDGQTAGVLSGCGPVAVGQLMKYYEWPDTVCGDYSYLDQDKQTRSVKMDGTRIEWDKLKNIYFYHDKDSDSLAPLMKMVGMSMTVKYGESSTLTLAKYIKRAMTTHFGYSPEMYLAICNETPEPKMIRLIRNNLRLGRPCVLIGGDHVFVCDGAYRDFLHLNMGWNGSYDGWYRFPIVSDRINDKAFIVSALLDIKPLLDKKNVEKTVVVERAGTLPELLTDTEKATLNKLTISGKLNGRDIRLLRRMAGAVDVADIESWKGQLTDLDISRAFVITDTVSYFEVPKGVYNPISPINLTTYNATIGRRMFCDCENLRHISLPQNTRYIYHRAFANCYALEDIAIPATVRGVTAQAFLDCRSLKKVTVCEDSPLLKSDFVERNKVFQWCSPDLQILKDSTLGTFGYGWNEQ